MDDGQLPMLVTQVYGDSRKESGTNVFLVLGPEELINERGLELLKASGLIRVDQLKSRRGIEPIISIDGFSAAGSGSFCGGSGSQGGGGPSIGGSIGYQPSDFDEDLRKGVRESLATLARFSPNNIARIRTNIIEGRENYLPKPAEVRRNYEFGGSDNGSSGSQGGNSGSGGGAGGFKMKKIKYIVTPEENLRYHGIPDVVKKEAFDNGVNIYLTLQDKDFKNLPNLPMNNPLAILENNRRRKLEQELVRTIEPQIESQSSSTFSKALMVTAAVALLGLTGLGISQIDFPEIKLQPRYSQSSSHYYGGGSSSDCSGGPGGGSNSRSPGGSNGMCF